jgi:optic atrophy 3 protein
MAGLPLAKIFAVFLKEAAKPVAGQLKKYAVDHPVFRRLTMGVGRAYENGTQRIEIAFRGHHVRSLKPVPDAHALTVGADVVSQSFLLSVAIGIVVFEYWRSDKQKRIENAVKKKEKQERQAAKEVRMKALEDRIAELEKRLHEAEHGPLDKLIEAASSAIPALPAALAKPKADSSQKATDIKEPVDIKGKAGEEKPTKRPRSESEEACETLHIPRGTFDSFAAPQAAAEALNAAKRAAQAKKEEEDAGLLGDRAEEGRNDEYARKGWGYAGGRDIPVAPAKQQGALR